MNALTLHEVFLCIEDSNLVKPITVRDLRENEDDGSYHIITNDLRQIKVFLDEWKAVEI